MSRRIVIFGPPGAGKGTHAKRLARDLRIPHIATGDMFRQAIQQGTAFGREAEQFIRRGELVPDALVEGVLRERLSATDVAGGYLLDGFPRTLPQAEALVVASRAAAGGERAWPHLVLRLEAPEEVLVSRIAGRATCQVCQAVFNHSSRPPQVEGVCDQCGGGLVERPDDAEAAVRLRLREYRDKTSPVLEFFAGQAWPVRTVESVGDVEEIYKHIRKAVGEGGGVMAIELKTPAQISKLREANLIAADVLDHLQEATAPGMSTWDLDQIAARRLKQLKGKSAFMGYRGYPAVLCTSVNNVVVHGIPRKDVVLREGDILSIDFGAFKDGWCGDSARTIPVGKVSEGAQALMEATRLSLEAAIAQCIPGNRLGDIGWAVQSLVEARGYSVVRQFVGHGIGQKMHEAPHVPNYGDPGRGTRLSAGLVVAIEPMVNQGGADVIIEDDGWTAVTKDGSLSAHFEHSVAITEEGPFVLSRA